MARAAVAAKSADVVRKGVTGASKTVEKAASKGQEVAKKYLANAVKVTTGVIYSGLYYGSYYGTLGVLGASDLISRTFMAEAVREGINDAVKRRGRGKGVRKKGKR